MGYREEVISKLIGLDDYCLNEMCNEISRIFKREYRGHDDVYVYLIRASIYYPAHEYYRNKTIKTISKVPNNRYIIPDHVMYRLQYELAKRYSIVFTERPYSFYEQSQYWNTKIKLTRLELNLK